MMLPFILTALGLIWFAYNSGIEFAGFHRTETKQELSDLHEKLDKITKENIQAGKKVAQYRQQIQMEHGRSHETALQLKTLNDENARLHEDLSFFQNLTSANGKEGELVIHRLSVNQGKITGEYLVRMLLVQNGHRVKVFTGSYQLVATIIVNGRKTTQLFPSNTSERAQYKLNFKYYQRLEQSLQLPPDAKLKSIQIRLFERGTLEAKVRQSTNLI
ncbi:MAG: DUF6776 family protein [Gallionella sp.]